MSRATAKGTGAKWLPRAIGLTSVACAYVMVQFKHVPHETHQAPRRASFATELAGVPDSLSLPEFLADRSLCEVPANAGATPWDSLPPAPVAAVDVKPAPAPVIRPVSQPVVRRHTKARHKAHAKRAHHRVAKRRHLRAHKRAAVKPAAPVVVAAPAILALPAIVPTPSPVIETREANFDPDLDSVDSPALDGADPLSDWIAQVAGEQPLLGDFHEERGMSAASVDEEMILDMQYPEETRLVEVMGTIQPTDFSELRNPLAEAKAESEGMKTAVVAPSEPVLPELPKEAVAPALAMAPKETVVETAPSETPAAETTPAVALDANKNVLVAAAPTAEIKAPKAEPKVAKPEPELVRPEPEVKAPEGPKNQLVAEAPASEPPPSPSPRLLSPKEIMARALAEDRAAREAEERVSSHEKNVLAPADLTTQSPPMAMASQDETLESDEGEIVDSLSSRLRRRTPFRDRSPVLAAAGPKNELVVPPSNEEASLPKNFLVAAAPPTPPAESRGPAVVFGPPTPAPVLTPSPSASISSAPAPAPAPSPDPAPREAAVEPTPEPPPAPVAERSLPAPRPSLARGSNRSVQAAPKDNREIGTHVYGVLHVDDDAQVEEMPLAQWIAEGRGHMELAALPANSRNPIDWIHIGKRNPEDEFTFEATPLRGPYNVYVTIYKKGLTTALAPKIPCRAEVNADTAPSKLICQVTRINVERALTARRNVASRGLLLTGTIFELKPGSAREEVPLSGALVSIKDYPEWKPVTTGSDGNFRFEGIPSGSELTLEVIATDYYRAVETVVTFNEDAYAPISLIPRSKTAVVTKQQKGKGIVFGRLFDPETHAPLANGTAEISFRSEPTLYFGSEARAMDVARDPFSIWIAKWFGAYIDRALRATDELGLFAMDNLSPSIRLVTRPGKLPQLVEILPDTAQYLEFARGTVKSLHLVVSDLLQKDPPDAKVKVVGLKKGQEADALGNVEIDGIDLSTGILSFEAEAEGYPPTRLDVPWNPMQPDRPRKFPLIEKEIIEDALRAAKSRAQVTVDRTRGMLAGLLEESFFPRGIDCVRSELVDMSGNKVDASHGPFPIHLGSSSSRQCITRDNPEYLYINLPEGRYRQRLVTADGRLLRAHIRYVARDGRLTMSLN